MNLKIGILAFQGAIDEHMDMLSHCGVNGVKIKDGEELKKVDGLIIPGGESTTIGSFLNRRDMVKPIKEFAADGNPVMGTCAGLVLLARYIEGQDKTYLDLMDIKVKRNAFGRQKESFEAYLEIPQLGEKGYKGVFIRAPYITDMGEKVQELANFDGKTVAAKEKNILVGSFHPELTEDSRWHEYFVKMVHDSANVSVR